MRSHVESHVESHEECTIKSCLMLNRKQIWFLNAKQFEAW